MSTSDSPANIPQDDLAHADIGLVCALPMELAPLLKRCQRVRKYQGGDFTFRGGRYGEIKLAMVESGMGMARAKRATQALIEAHTPQWVLSVGFCGALVPEMKIGHVLMANSIVDQHGHELHFELNVDSNPGTGLHVGRLITTDEIVRLVSEKKELAEQYSATAADMESLGVAQVCSEQKTKFMAVRCASDDLSADLPAEILTVMGNSGSFRMGAALGAVWKRPKSVKEMWKLRENAYKAADHLTSFLDGVLVQLHRTISAE